MNRKDDLINPAPVLSGSAAATPTTLPSPRLLALDALRGFNMFWILGADYFMNALGQMSGHPFCKGLAWQLDHAEWEGFHYSTQKQLAGEGC
jgi:hypothetical protein